MAWMLGTHHLIGIRPTRPGRRKQHDARAPEIIHSGSFDECYERMGKIARPLIEKDLAQNGLPVFLSDDWAYYICEAPSPDWQRCRHQDAFGRQCSQKFGHGGSHTPGL